MDAGALHADPAAIGGVVIQGKLAIVAGSLLKQRLLAGALRLEPEETAGRRGGSSLLGRVIESEAVGSLAIGGGSWVARDPRVALAKACSRSRRRFSLSCSSFGLRSRGACHDLSTAPIGMGRRARPPDARLIRGDGRASDAYRAAAARAMARRRRRNARTIRAFVGRMDQAAVLVIGVVPRGWMVAASRRSRALRSGRTAATLAVSLGGSSWRRGSSNG